MSNNVILEVAFHLFTCGSKSVLAAHQASVCGLPEPEIVA